MHWCLGMYSSGSTWIYNVTRKVAAALQVEPQLGLRFVLGEADLQDLTVQGQYQIVKSHEVDEAGTALLAGQAATILLTVRDPRDAVTSLMLYQQLDFPDAVAAIDRAGRYCRRFADHPKTVLLQYESGFTEDATTIDRIAATFGRALPPAERTRLVNESSRAAIEAEIKGLESLPTAVRDERSGDMIDSLSHWHSHHANRTGEVGRWRWMLTPSQAGEIEWRMRDWMDALGYRRGAG